MSLPIKHIVGPIESLANTQMGLEPTNDSALDFQMWGGKDDAGNVTKWLAKGKAGLLKSLQVSDFAGNGLGLVRYNANGELYGAPFVADDLPPHNDLDGLNDGEFQHLTTSEKSLLHNPVTLAPDTPLTLSGQTLGFDDSGFALAEDIIVGVLDAAHPLQDQIDKGVSIFQISASYSIPAGTYTFPKFEDKTPTYEFVGEELSIGQDADVVFNMAGGGVTSEFKFHSRVVSPRNGSFTVDTTKAVYFYGGIRCEQLGASDVDHLLEFPSGEMYATTVQVDDSLGSPYNHVAINSGFTSVEEYRVGGGLGVNPSNVVTVDGVVLTPTNVSGYTRFGWNTPVDTSKANLSDLSWVAEYDGVPLSYGETDAVAFSKTSYQDDGGPTFNVSKGVFRVTLTTDLGSPLVSILSISSALGNFEYHAISNLPYLNQFGEVVVYDNAGILAVDFNGVGQNFIHFMQVTPDTLSHITNVKVESQATSYTESITGSEVPMGLPLRWVENNYRNTVPSALVSEDGLSTVELKEGGDGPVFAIEGCEMSLGTPADPHEASFGEGDSVPVDQAWHCEFSDIAGNTVINATDISAEYSSKSGSTAGLFGGTTAGKTLIVGMDYPYQGVKVNLATLGSVNPGNLVLESWIGPSTSNPVSYMATNSTNTWLESSQKANNICTDLSEHWRFGFDPLVASSWTPQTLNINGVNITKYWGRFVIISDIVEDPQVELMKAHTNHSEKNPDGSDEYFGVSRPSFPLQARDVVIANGAIDPANENVAYGVGVTAKYIDNELSNTADDGFLITQAISLGIDTSIPLTCKLSYYVKGTATGDAVLDVQVFQVTDGFVYDGTALPDQVISVTDTVGVASDMVRRTVVFQVDAEKVTPGEALLISIARNAVSNAADTLGNPIIRTFLTVTGYRWS